MAVIDLRGTNGSGKSWAMREILKRKNLPVSEDGVELGRWVPELKCVVLGRYTGSVGGGCDGFKGGAKQVEAVVRMLHDDFDHILLEGIMVSHLYQRFHDLASSLPDYRFLFLNTPLKKCIARVRMRRRQKGNDKPFDPQKNLVKDYDRIWKRVRSRLTEAGHKVVIVDWRDPVTAILKEIGHAVG